MNPIKSNPLNSPRITIVLFAIALLLIVAGALFTVRVEHVSGTEVGVKVNNMTGEIEIIRESGANIYNGFLHSFYLLDNTVQRLEMTATRDRGDRNSKDDLRIKTVDGSDVYLDLTINYRVRPDRIEEIVTTSGLYDAYKVKWIRDYSRSICRTVFGEMTTEQFYDASERGSKAQQAEIELNNLLNPFGIDVTGVIAEKFRFHQEYEEKIRAKKLADQSVEEQVSKANAARQNQIFRTVEADKKKEVLLAEYRGEMRQRIVDAEAQAERVVKEAEAYAIERRTEGDREFYEKEQNAKAILAQATAEAKATEERAKALDGEGGLNLVKLAYAQRLNNLSIEAQPFSIENKTERIAVSDESAAAARKAANK
ncbi:MAG: SPFH domain-containing protein [Opitutales bacterium]